MDIFIPIDEQEMKRNKSALDRDTQPLIRPICSDIFDERDEKNV